MVRHLLVCAFSSNQPVFLDVHFLHVTSNVQLGLAVTFINSLCGTNICVRNDKRVQATHCALCGNYQENNNCRTQSDIFPPLNQLRSSLLDCYRIYRDGL